MKENIGLPNKIILLGLLFATLFSIQAYSQESKGFEYYDSLTYNLYLAGNWKSLKSAGKDALTSGLDYFYLRVRIGIADYNLRNYRSAALNFEKALTFNSDDPAVLPYLYYAYLESGQVNAAAKLAAKNKGVLSEVQDDGLLGYKSVYAEGGFTPDNTPTLSSSELMGNDSIYGETNIYREQKYYHAGLTFQPLKSIMIYAGFSKLNADKEKQFAYNLAQIQRDSIVSTPYSLDYYYSFPIKTTDTIIPYRIQQTEFYFSAGWLLGKGILVTPSFHLLGGTTKNITAAFETYTTSDTAYFLKSDSTWHTFDYQASRYLLTSTENSYNNYVLSLSITKEMGNFTLGLNSTYAKLTASGNQFQIGASLTWFPFGNLDLYSTTTITHFSSGNQNRIIFDEALGGRVLPKLWIEGSITAGNLSLFNEKNAFVVYNLPEIIRFRCGANLIYTLSKHIDVSLMYRFFTREYNYYQYTNDLVTDQPVMNTNSVTYNNYGIFGGLKWKF